MGPEIVLGLVAASTAMGAIGSVTSGIASSNAAKYNAQVADQNASIARQQADANAQKVRRQVGKTLATQRTQIAKSNVMGPTAADIASDSLIEGELDVLNTMYQGEMAAYNYEQEATMQRSKAKSAMTSGLIGGASAVLSGAASGYSMNSMLNPSVSPLQTRPVGGINLSF